MQNKLLGMPPIPNATGEWGRMWACTAVVLGYYYLQAAFDDNKQFAKSTVYGRPLIFLLMLFSQLPSSLALLGFFDCLGAAWTWRALKEDEKANCTKAS
jgi:hypothetical protein